MISKTNKQKSLLRLQRELHSWTLNQAADALYTLCVSEGEIRKRGDINAQMISAWERGKHPPSLFWQKLLRKLYGKSAEELGFVRPLNIVESAQARTSATIASIQHVDPVTSLSSGEERACEKNEGALPFDKQLQSSTYSPHVVPGQLGALEAGNQAGIPSDILRGIPAVYIPIPLHQALDVLQSQSAMPLEHQRDAWIALLTSDFPTLFDLQWSIDEVLDTQRIMLEGLHMMPERIRNMISRRIVLDRFFKLTVAAMAGTIPLPSVEKHVTFEEQAQLCRAFGENIAEGWKFFHTAGNAQVLALGQAQLYMVQQCHAFLPSRDRSKFYASIYNLIGIALQHRGDCEKALEAHTNAHVAALGTGDPWFVTQSLICQANGHQTLGQHADAIETLEEALRTIGHTEEEHLRSRAHLLGCWADNAMLIGDHLMAQRKLEASAAYLDQIGPNEEFDRANWHQLYGKYAFMTGDYTTALAHFKQALAELPPHWIVRQVLILLPMMATYAHQHDREASFAIADKALFAIHALNAPSMNKTFAVTLCGLLDAFPNDVQVQAFVADRLHA